MKIELKQTTEDQEAVEVKVGHKILIDGKYFRCVAMDISSTGGYSDLTLRFTDSIYY